MCCGILKSIAFGIPENRPLAKSSFDDYSPNKSECVPVRASSNSVSVNL